MRWLLLTATLALVGGGAWWLLRSPDEGANLPDGSVERAATEEDRGPRLEGGGAGLSATARTGRGAVLGRVTRAGVPAVATIEVHRLGGPELAERRPDRTRRPSEVFRVPEPRRPVASGPSDAQGQFEVGGLASGLYCVTARGADGAHATADALLAAEGTRKEITLALQPANLVFEGSVRYADGRPFPGTLLVVHAPDGGDWGLWGEFDREGGRTAELGADGAFRLERLAAGSYVLQVIGRDGSTVLGRSVVLPAPVPYAFIVPTGTQNLSGSVVVAGSGQPVAGAVVVVTWYAPDDTAVNVLLASDAAGRFAASVGSESIDVVAEAPGHGRASVHVEPGIREVTLRLIPVARVAGRVTDKAGAGAGGAVVLASTHRWEGAERASATADPDGRYAFEALAAGSVTLVVRGGGWVSPGLSEANGDGFNPFEHPVPAGSSTSIDLVAVRGALIEGSVLDATGAPVAGATLEAAVHESYFGPREMLVRGLGTEACVSGADGSFEFGSLAAGSDYVLLAQSAGQALTLAGPFPAGDSPTRVEVRFPPARYVDVQVLFEDDGSPVEGALVALFAAGDRGIPLPGRWTGIDTVTTDAQGRARLGPAAKGELHVRAGGLVVAGGSRNLQAQRHSLPAGAAPVPGSAEGAGPFALTLRVARGLTIEGRVQTPDGKPAAAANVSAHSEGTQSHFSEGQVGADGSFVLRGLRPGTYSVFAGLHLGGQHILHATRKIDAGAKDVTLTLSETSSEVVTASLEVRVLDPEGQPVPWAQVEVRTKNHSSGMTARDGVVRFQVTRGTPSETEDADRFVGGTVRAWGARGADGTPLPLGPGQAGPLGPGQTEITVRLTAGRRIEGRVLDERGQAVPGVRVTARRRAEDGSQGGQVGMSAARSDGSGAFRIAGLAEGVHALEVKGSPDMVPVEPVVASTGDANVEIRVRRGVTARVIIRDDRGAPVAGVTVEVTPAMPEGTRENPIPIERIHAWDRDRGRLQRSLPSEVNGTVSLRGLDPAIVWLLRVQPHSGHEELRAWEQNPWTPGDTEVRLERAFAVRGTVVDGQGKPVEQATVHYRVGEVWNQTQPTGADGTFTIGGLGRGSVVLKAVPPSSHGVHGQTPSVPEVTVQAGTENVRLTVDPGPSLLVRIANPEVRGAAARHGALTAQLLVQGGARHEYGGWAHSHDGSGKLVFPGLKSDALYTVWIRPEASEWYGLATDLKAGGREVVVTLERGGTISGRVIAPPKAQHVNVQVQNDLLLQSSAQVDDQGRYEVKGLPPGIWTVRANGYTDGKSWTAEGRVSVGGTLDLTLEEQVQRPGR